MQRHIIPKGGLKRLTQFHQKGEGVLVQCRGDEFPARSVQIRGEAWVAMREGVFSIETYAEVEIFTQNNAFGVFLLEHETVTLQVIAPDEETARQFHPLNYDWDEKKGYWREGRKRDNVWPAPDKVSCRRIGDDHYAEIAHIAHTWQTQTGEQS